MSQRDRVNHSDGCLWLSNEKAQLVHRWEPQSLAGERPVGLRRSSHDQGLGVNSADDGGVGHVLGAETMGLD